jgi:hypothetical protein
MIRIASRVYANALIYSGARLSWKEALRLTDQKPAVKEPSRSAAA